MSCAQICKIFWDLKVFAIIKICRVTNQIPTYSCIVLASLASHNKPPHNFWVLKTSSHAVPGINSQINTDGGDLMTSLHLPDFSFCSLLQLWLKLCRREIVYTLCLILTSLRMGTCRCNWCGVGGRPTSDINIYTFLQIICSKTDYDWM